MEKNMKSIDKEELIAARSGMEYHGRIVAIQSDMVIQRDAKTNRLIAHKLQTLTGGSLTLDQEVSIRYPKESAIGLLFKNNDGLEKEIARELRKELPGAELER